MTERIAEGAEAVAASCAMVDAFLNTDVAFLRTNGLQHLDTRFRRLRTDGRRRGMSFGDARHADRMGADDPLRAYFDEPTVRGVVAELRVRRQATPVPPVGGERAEDAT
jgi:hypothetical protein